jgi:hypothetical protein
MPFRTRPLVLGAALAVALTTPLQAQTSSGGFSAAERQALMSHRLTMDNVRKMFDASSKLTALSKKDPTLGDVKPGEEAKSMAELTAKMDALAPAKAAIASSGLKTDEFVLTLFELQYVRSAVLLKEMGGDAAEGVENLPVSPANLQFYTANRAEIDKLAKALEGDDSEGSGKE